MSMRILLALILFFVTPVLQAQTDTYLADLTALKSILQKTPSYKAQIKGDNLAYYTNLFNRLSADSLNHTSDYQYFYHLSQLVFPLRDNHIGFHQVTDYKHFQNKETIEYFITTKAFLDYPRININIDSLKITLEKRPANSIEGIYHYDKFYSVGLFKNSDKEYIGVVVDSDINLWQVGQMAMYLYEYQPNVYKAIYGHPLTKSFILQPVEKYRNQSLVNSYFYTSYSPAIYSKDIQQVDHVNLPRDASKFAFKNINSTTQYLRIRSFQLNRATVLESGHFYDSIKNALTAPNLILDLRNNEGGSKKASKNYYKLVKKYSKRGQVYVLLNNGTLSRAEIFTLQLNKLKNVTTLGQTTKGMLTYGSNYGKREKLPSGKFEVYPTDMKGSANLLQYEDKGIDPDIFLNSNSDWIDQVVSIMKNK